MKEQYRKEVSQIHVPNDLLMRTKQAMKEEEVRLQKEKQKAKLVPFRVAAVAAAVIVLFLAYPAVTSLLKTGESQSLQGPEVMLSEKNHQLLTIDKGEILTGGNLQAEAVKEMPEEFEEAEEVMLEGKTVLIIQSKDGFWMAYVENEGQRLVISSEELQKNDFLDELENLL